MAAGAVAYIHYRILSGELLGMEEAQARREREARELDITKSNLETVLSDLKADSTSIVGSLSRTAA